MRLTNSKRILSFSLMLTLVFSLMIPISSFAAVGGGGRTRRESTFGETGRSNTAFRTTAVRFKKGEMKANDKITVCANNCTDGKYQTLTWKQFLNQSMKNKATVDKVLNASNVWIMAYQKPDGTLAYYRKDGTKKQPSDFYVQGDAEGNALAKENYVGLDKNGKISSGELAGILIADFITCPTGDCGPGKDKEIPPPLDIPGSLPPGHIQCDIGMGPEYLFSNTTETGTDTSEFVYSVYASLTPIVPIGFEDLSSEQQEYWYKTHHPQIIPPELTEFGQFLLDNENTLAELMNWGKAGVGSNSGYRKTWEALVAGARAEAAKGVQDLDITLSEDNKEGFGRGGSYTYTQFQKMGSISTTHYQDLYDGYDCVTKYREESYDDCYTDSDGDEHCTTYYYKVPYTEYEKTSSGNIIDGEYTGAPIPIVTSDDYTPSKSYQVLNVRCNKHEFDQIVASTGSTVLTYGSGKGTATAQSPILDSQIATFFNDLDIEFYYDGRDCDDVYGCTGAPNVGATNDSANNVGDKAEHTDGKFGAQSDGKSTSDFKFFRDNLSKPVRNDVWYPDGVASAEWDYNTKSAASATFITLDTKGTPQDDFFVLEDANKNEIINGKELKTKNHALFLDQQNLFHWRSSWASEKNLPHGMNIKYAYKPHTINIYPETLNADGIVSTGQSKYVLDMYCNVLFDTTDEYTPEIKNAPKPDTYKPISKFLEQAEAILRVSFIKSSIE